MPRILISKRGGAAMAKDEQKKQDNVSKKAPRKVFKGPLLTMMMGAAVVGLGYKLWENPKL